MRSRACWSGGWRAGPRWRCALEPGAVGFPFSQRRLPAPTARGQCGDALDHRIAHSASARASLLDCRLRHCARRAVPQPGLLRYAFIVRPQGHYSALAGGVVLALVMVPTVIRTTEEMLKLVPHSLREA